MRITWDMELPGGPDVELVAKTLYACNRYAGRVADENDWPPAHKATIKRYWTLATAVIEAQRAAKQARTDNDDQSGRQRA